MVENGCASEHVFEEHKHFLTIGGPIPVGALASESSKRDRHVRVVSNEMAVEISKPKEGLHILDLLWGWPVPNDLDLCFIHFEAVRAYNEA